MSVRGFDRVGSAMAVDGAAETRAEDEGRGPPGGVRGWRRTTAGDERRRFWEPEPRAALAALETAFEDADCASSSGSQNAWRAHFREWFERECGGAVNSSAAPARRSPRTEAGPALSRFSGTRDGPGDAMEASFGSFEDPSVPGRLTRAFAFFRGGEKPVATRGTDGVGTRDDFESSPTPWLSVDFEQRYLGGAFGTTGVFGQGGVGESSARDFGALGDAVPRGGFGSEPKRASVRVARRARAPRRQQARRVGRGGPAERHEAPGGAERRGGVGSQPCRQA